MNFLNRPQKIRITKEFSFEAAHALFNHDGLCKNIHGHSYKLYVTLIGEPVLDIKSSKNGMVMDYSQLKQIVSEEIIEPLDHAFIIYKASPQINLEKCFAESAVGSKVVKIDYPATCEMMLCDFAQKISSKLPGNVKLHSLKLYETATSFAQWFAEDNK